MADSADSGSKDQFFLDHGQAIRSESGTWYRCLETLGLGGNAVTFLAVATSGPNRGIPFAIKVFRRLSAPERRESFLAETAFLLENRHPSIMSIYDKGRFEKEFPFLVAEFLPLTLRDFLKRRPSIQLKLSFTMQLISGLAFLSKLDSPVIHRDLKPENIFVKGPSCVIGDFGLLKRQTATPDKNEQLDREDVKASLGVGMPRRYRTPDLVDYLLGKTAITTKSDVFQLGLVLAEMFSGWNPSKPYREITDPVELDEIRYVPGRFREEITKRINRMLAPTPEKRPTAYQLLDLWDPLYKEVCEAVYPLENSVFSRNQT